MSEKPKESNDQLFLTAMAGLGCMFLIRLWNKWSPSVRHFWRDYGWQLIFIGVAGVSFLFLYVASYLWNRYVESRYLPSLTERDDKAVYLGKDEKGRDTYVKEPFRTSHTLVIGTTSAGKTESVVLPWAIHDIEKGNGCLIIDGKADAGFLDKLYAYVKKAGREKDFYLFSLANLPASCSFNPLQGGTVQEAAERTFSAFKIDNPYYAAVQYKIYLALLRLIQNQGATPTFALVHRLLMDAEQLTLWVEHCTDSTLKKQLELYCCESPKDRMEKVSGLDACLSHFSSGELASLFNAENPHIQMNTVLKSNSICYFQLPTMYYPILASVTGTLVLQSLQAAISKRHLQRGEDPKFFSVFLDDFQDYIYEGFAGLLNKSRSANVGVVFSHQSLGDLDKVSPAFRNVVLTCTNIKVIMRCNEPETCDYLAKTFGTETTEKVTERQTKTLFGQQKTGEGSVRETEQYRFHPNTIKQLAVGQGIVSIPHPRGVKSTKIAFARRPNLLSTERPLIEKPALDLDKHLYQVQPSDVKKDHL